MIFGCGGDGVLSRASGGGPVRTGVPFEAFGVAGCRGRGPRARGAPDSTRGDRKESGTGPLRPGALPRGQEAGLSHYGRIEAQALAVFTVSFTSMFPRVALEYGQTPCASSMSARASSRGRSGEWPISSTARPKPPSSVFPMSTFAVT